MDGEERVRTRDLKHTRDRGAHTDEMDATPGALGLPPGAKQYIEPGGVTELPPGAVDDQPGESPLHTFLQRLAQQCGGVVVELSRQCHDRAGAMAPDLDP
jgi:hypothetical protein